MTNKLKVSAAFVLVMAVFLAVYVVCFREAEVIGEYPFKFDRIDAIFYLPNYTNQNLVKADDSLNNPVQRIHLAEKYHQQLRSVILGDHRPPAGNTECYSPRHGFIFYQGGRIVGWFEYCLSCGHWRFSESFSLAGMRNPSMREMKEFSKEIGLIVLDDEALYGSILANGNNKPTQTGDMATPTAVDHGR